MCQMQLPQRTEKLLLTVTKIQAQSAGHWFNLLGDSLPFTVAATHTATLLQIHRKDKTLNNSQVRKGVSFC